MSGWPCCKQRKIRCRKQREICCAFAAWADCNLWCACLCHWHHVWQKRAGIRMRGISTALRGGHHIRQLWEASHSPSGCESAPDARRQTPASALRAPVADTARERAASCAPAKDLPCSDTAPAKDLLCSDTAFVTRCITLRMPARALPAPHRLRANVVSVKANDTAVVATLLWILPLLASLPGSLTELCQCYCHDPQFQHCSCYES
jgi:hypothetical protein